ncbi:MAG: 50S ribosomal protein L18 [Planctomycetes bacterium]|nr:50S ribosomal protein L18 [Planctomycetota bacterium]
MEGNIARNKRRRRRKRGLRKTIRGTPERPRLTVFRSAKHIYAQIIDDFGGITLCEASTRSKGVRDEIENGGNIVAAKMVGKALAERALAKDVKTVCFDRSGYRFHGRLKALADAAREAGLGF